MKTYKFYYTPLLQRDKKGKNIYVPKPIINLAINFKKSNPLSFWFLIDSGADHNLFPGYLGDLLNINVGTIGIVVKEGPVFRHYDVFINNKINTLTIFYEENEVKILK